MHTPDVESPRILVTGATGFMGRHLTQRLLANGADVAVMARKPGNAPMWMSSQCRLIEVTQDVESWTGAVETFVPTACFHLAAQSIQVHDKATITPLLDANITLGTHLLHALSACGPVRFVSVGSMWQHHEGREYGPSSLYAATKQAFADIVQYFVECTDITAATVEFPDTYGPEDDRKKLLRLLLQAHASGEALQMSPGEQIIEMVHIDDVVDALLGALSMASHQAPRFQIPGEVLNLREFVALVSLLLGSPIPVSWGARPYRPRETMTPWRYHGPVPGWRQQRSVFIDLAACLDRPQVVRLPQPRTAPVTLPTADSNDQGRTANA